MSLFQISKTIFLTLSILTFSIPNALGQASGNPSPPDPRPVQVVDDEALEVLLDIMLPTNQANRETRTESERLIALGEQISPTEEEFLGTVDTTFEYFGDVYDFVEEYSLFNSISSFEDENGGFTTATTLRGFTRDLTELNLWPVEYQPGTGPVPTTNLYYYQLLQIGLQSMNVYSARFVNPADPDSPDLETIGFAFEFDHNGNHIYMFLPWGIPQEGFSHQEVGEFMAYAWGGNDSYLESRARNLPTTLFMPVPWNSSPTPRGDIDCDRVALANCLAPIMARYDLALAIARGEYYDCYINALEDYNSRLIEAGVNGSILGAFGYAAAGIVTRRVAQAARGVRLIISIGVGGFTALNRLENALRQLDRDISNCLDDHQSKTCKAADNAAQGALHCLADFCALGANQIEDAFNAALQSLGCKPLGLN